MKTKSIHYSKVFSLGNYENEKIGVDIEVQEGDDIQKVIQTAREFVEFNHSLNGFQNTIDHCEHVINNPDDYTGRQVSQAKQNLEEIHAKMKKGTTLLIN